MKTYLLIFLIALTTHGISQNIFPASGNVGIGTTNPAYTLEISNANTANNLRIVSSNVNGARMNFVSNSANGRDFGIGSNFVSGNGEFAIYDYTAGTERFSIANNGNVGIGTTSPTEKLSVNGNIRSQKIIVTQTGWSDYVFDSSYQLQPLTELEKFIKNNKHLPDVPSTKEIEKEGIDLGENQAVLLKKIEELTLYVIEMKKEIQVLQKENAQQKIAIRQLQSK